MTAVTSSQIRLKTVALPPEHGAWGFLLEPILLGLLIAPSWAGLCLAAGVVGGFLVRHPLKIALVDRQRARRYARTRAAEQFALAYGVIALAGLGGAALLAGPGALLPLAASMPLGLIAFAGYVQNRGRELLPELAGASALALTAPALLLAAGGAWRVGLALWTILLARNIPSILYIRTRLRLEKGKRHAPAVPLVAHGIAVVGVAALVLSDLAPWLVVLAAAILAGRAAWGLSPLRRQVSTPTLGVLEMVYGVLVVVLAAVGYS